MVALLDDEAVTKLDIAGAATEEIADADGGPELDEAVLALAEGAGGAETVDEGPEEQPTPSITAFIDDNTAAAARGMHRGLTSAT